MTSSDTISILTTKIKISRCVKCICCPLTIWWKGHNSCCTQHTSIHHTVKQFCLYEVKNNTEYILCIIHIIYIHYILIGIQMISIQWHSFNVTAVCSYIGNTKWPVDDYFGQKM